MEEAEALLKLDLLFEDEVLLSYFDVDTVAFPLLVDMDLLLQWIQPLHTCSAAEERRENSPEIFLGLLTDLGEELERCKSKRSRVDSDAYIGSRWKLTLKKLQKSSF